MLSLIWETKGAENQENNKVNQANKCTFYWELVLILSSLTDEIHYVLFKR